MVQLQGRWEYRPIPAEQEVIARIRSGCVGGRGYAAMARELNEDRVPTATGVPWDRATVRGIYLRGPESFQILATTGSSARGATTTTASERRQSA